MQMHPQMQQRIDTLRLLMIRTDAARETFARLAGLVMPEKKVRFQVTVVGKAYRVVEISTGKTMAFRWNYKAALDMAIQFEDKGQPLRVGEQ